MGRPSHLNNSNPESYAPRLNTKYGGQQHVPQVHPPAGYTYESYQSPITAAKATALGSNSKPVSLASSPAATPHARDIMADADTPMEDADPYNRSKYSARLTHNTRPSSQYMPTEESSSAARRYSPMNILSPTLPYASSPTKGQNPFVASPPGPSSSRQSPTRAYASPPQIYQSPPGQSCSRSTIISLTLQYD
jgi:dual specificity protein kinase YAK1